MFLQRALRRPASIRATAITLTLFLAFSLASVARAGQPVTGALNPQPPDFYSCKAIGSGTICQATTSDSWVLEPSGIVCGTGPDAVELLDTGGRDVKAIRYYDRDGNWTRRIRTLLFKGGSLTNPLNGATAAYVQHNTDVDELAVPGDFSTSAFTGHGVLSITVPGYGSVVLEAGVAAYDQNGELTFGAGPTDLSDYFAGDTSVVADLCAALGA